MSTPSEKVAETKIFEGSQIKGLFSKPKSVDLIVESETYGNIKFVVRPMNNDIYAQIGDVMKSMSTDSISDPNDIDALKVFSNVYYPAMKVVFPYCSIEPKIVDGTSTDQESLSLKDIPIEVCMSLFKQIMDASGLSKEDEETRKN